MASTSDSRAEEALLLSRVQDVVRHCERRHSAQYLGFLDQKEQYSVRRELNNSDVQWLFYGGYEDAERCLLGVFPSYIEPDEALYPLSVVAFHYRQERSLTHRDVLGTLMSYGLRRDCIGDILCGEGIAVVYLKDEIVSFVCDQVSKIGGEGVRVQRDYDGPIPSAHSYMDIRDTIASPRLDAVVKALVKCSREQASTLILSESVSIDHCPVSSVSSRVEVGAVISVRGHGRFVIDALGPETKKGRLHFEARKYV